ncbi:MAG: lysophospholipid acyltransferase family protein [Halioglobus sp.]|nr:lysophospholipid acyltransferase family protein [Halioglobus sp.]
MAKARKSRGKQDEAEYIQEIIDGTLSLDEEAVARRLSNIYRWLKIFMAPTVVGRDNIPQGPCLYIANHSTMAADVLVTVPALYEASGRLVRGMSDEIMYRNKRMREFVVGTGAVMGNQRIGDALFEAGKDVLLFPGGAYEANKDLEHRYEVMWKERTGFTRLAARQGVPIVPLGIVGPDEWFGRYMDRSEVADSWLGRLMKLAGASDEFMHSDQLPPIPRGLFGSVLIPKPQRVYISIGKPISTKRYKGKNITRATQEKLRDEARNRLEQCIADMLLLQAQDKDSSGILRKLLTM